MSINITMPALSPTMEEGTLAKWHVKEGDSVSSGDVIAEIETDKATMEVEAVDEGTIGKIVVPEGTEGVKVNAVIAVILTEGESADDVKLDDAAPQEGKATDGAPAKSGTQPAAPEAPSPAAAPAGPARSAAPAPQPSSRGGDAGRVFSSPLARRLAREAGIDIAAVSGTGPRGRVVKADIEAAKSGKVPL